MSKQSKTKYIFVTGGVVSGLGKGVACACIGNILERYGMKVTFLKLDPYLNMDPGTMSPFQHGEVFVTDDGAETDLDLGHYERFSHAKMRKANNATAGQVYNAIIELERKGQFLGKTIQIIPHITDEIKKRIYDLSNENDVVITEIGGTVGDIESLPFLEAIRQVRVDMGQKNVIYIHLTLIPFLNWSKEFKTKPTQHSVATLRSIGIQPDILMVRCPEMLQDELNEKIAMFCNIRKECVINAIDVDNIYRIPENFEKQGLGRLMIEFLDLPCTQKKDDEWQRMLERIENPSRRVDIAIVGKYVQLEDSYKSLTEAFTHAGISNDAKVELHWINARRIRGEKLKEELLKYDGLMVPGGFGETGIEGKIEAIRIAREKKIPFFGICLGMQCAVIEFARNKCNMHKANSTEFDKKTRYKVIMEMKGQKRIKKYGGTMRLGGHYAKLAKGSLARKIYGSDLIFERHRHRYEFNRRYMERLTEKGLVFSGINPQDNYVEMLELPGHPFFIGCQFHPEFKSRPYQSHPLFHSFIEACLMFREKKNQR